MNISAWGSALLVSTGWAFPGASERGASDSAGLHAFFYAFTYTNTNTNPTVTVVLDRRHLRNNGYIPQRIFADKVKGTCCRTWRGVYCREGSKRNARPCCKRVSTSWLTIDKNAYTSVSEPSSKNRE